MFRFITAPRAVRLSLMGSSLAFAAALGACSQSSAPGPSPQVDGVTATPKAECGPGSRPETGIQGRVSIEDHESGRAALGYTCNTELVGSYIAAPNPRGTVGGFKVHRYFDKAGHECAFYDSTLLWPFQYADDATGINVLDMTDHAKPVLTATLLSPAMQTPHESLVLDPHRGLLMAVAGTAAMYPGVLDIWDASADCRAPVFKSSTPVAPFGHESGLSPDGMTFYVGSPGTPTVVAVDVSDPMVPKPLGNLPYYSHGMMLSADGNRAYMACIGPSGSARAFSNGQITQVPDPDNERALVIVDVSDFQARKVAPQAREISRLTWSPMSIPQNAIPFTSKGKPYILEIDEYGQQTEVGAGRIIDVSDETKPFVVSNLRLEVHDPANFAAQAGDPGATFAGQGYAGHYCSLPTQTDPAIAACSMILSGLRVFDIRDVYHPREVAYFNAPIPAREVPFPTAASNYAMSAPAYDPARKEVWYTDTYSGFYVVRLTNGAWPE
jgi:hypothetical protein